MFITQFVIRFFLYLPGSSQTDDPGKYKKSLVSLSNSLEYTKIQSYIKRPPRFSRRSITYDLLYPILFYALLNDVNKFCDVRSSTLVARRDNVLKEIFPPGNYKLYFQQKLQIFNMKIY